MLPEYVMFSSILLITKSSLLIDLSVGWSLECFRYHGYHDNTYPYKFSKQYWHVIAARLAFVFVFQFTVYLITSFIAWAVPDVPKDLELTRKREDHLAKLKFGKARDDETAALNAEEEML